jgi:hypothetical protein
MKRRFVDTILAFTENSFGHPSSEPTCQSTSWSETNGILRKEWPVFSVPVRDDKTGIERELDGRRQEA